MSVVVLHKLSGSLRNCRAINMHCLVILKEMCLKILSIVSVHRLTRSVRGHLRGRPLYCWSRICAGWSIPWCPTSSIKAM